MSFKVIDLFSGAGGMTLGFLDPSFGGGFKSSWALDNDPAAVRTYRANFGDHAECLDIEEVVREERKIPNADVVVGGPPCQGFSLLNKQKQNDARRSLWQPFLDIVAKSGARVFLIENVRWLLGSREGVLICEEADRLGYDTDAGVFNSADYGTPQIRWRAFIIGWKRGETQKPVFPPSKTNSEPGSDSDLPRWRTVRDVIEDLPGPIGTEIRPENPPYNLHFGRSPTELSKRRYRLVPEGGNRFDLQANAPELTPKCWINKKTGGSDLFGRLWWDKPSVTIRTEFFKPEKGRYLHPSAHRSITHREAARLMGIPDSFVFAGTKLEIARQIGNAVPPQLSGAFARIIHESLKAKGRMAA